MQSGLRQLHTVCQVSFILLVVLRLQFAWPPDALLLGSGAAVYATVIVSGIDYVLVYGRKAADGLRARHQMLRAGGSKAA